MKSNEIWRDIPGFEGLYQASNLGNIKSLNFNKSCIEKELSKYKCRGYLGVKLTKNGIGKNYLVHRLVIWAFKGLNLNYEINHKDGNKQNNNINNLEYCTRSENVLHAYRTGLKKAKSGINHPRAKSVVQMKDGKIVKIYDFMNEVEKYGFCHTKVSMCCQHKRNKHKGYIWKYASEVMNSEI